MFVDGSADLSQVARDKVKMGEHWQQGVSTWVSEDQTHDLVGILLGDVNGNYQPEDPQLV